MAFKRKRNISELLLEAHKRRAEKKEVCSILGRGKEKRGRVSKTHWIMEEHQRGNRLVANKGKTSPHYDVLDPKTTATGRE